jgi:hypothetical protein
MAPTRIRLFSFLLWAALLSGCGGDDPLAPDPAVAAFVGDWEATDFIVTSVVNPQIVEDVLGLGATFEFNVQPSGRYTATLNFIGQPSVEIGQLSVSGTTVTLSRSIPSAQTSASTFSFVGTDVLIMDGATEYDFNSDGTPDDALAHIELLKIN